MNCEVIELPNDAIATKTEYKGKCILLIAKVTEHNKDKHWLCCYKCGLLGSLGDHSVFIVDTSVTVEPSILCPRCNEHYFIKKGVVC